MRLKKIIRIQGQIVALTGLRIGGSKEGLEIGGIDLPVIRHGQEQLPYIPGSSLKGKMRFLCEWKAGRVDLRHKKGQLTAQVHTCEDQNCPVCRVFGSTDSTWGPTRLLVRDAFLDQGWVRTARERFPLLTETKTENAINRLWGKAENPRTGERVPAGARFDLEMIYRVFDLEGLEGAKPDEEFLEAVVWPALRLVELDSLGASGSRGYGKVRFAGLTRSELDLATGQWSEPQGVDLSTYFADGSQKVA
jgi:CRISPR-associated protein Csm3